ncbi:MULTISPECIES: hypothetical protein [Xanthomonas]|jgi:hypothetical protein|uniref:Uncharacterized protein n=5 Tax=Xanthomonas TaxID=338 RepID=A0A837ANZ1_XANVA|nr:MULTISPECIES: hypothetical protein [Xanthomonas]KGT54016.1 hypothetical protein NY96_19745 [Xanthomonas citri pv. fuscans]ARR15300.1 hypothetical protein B7L66_24285 [Xanthomonas citri pv. citri]ARR20042.1 hypothetical protein B7L65_24640 [Xanthomonas citri pv. citri]ARR24675.1 hypothetical protein B7L67_24595 [Xanthomonas citri pv. citri]ATS86798.1 hypothetical protein XcfCFBP6991P_23205 [Xanthomonas citri pv. phaseoli var. fuscans]
MTAMSPTERSMFNIEAFLRSRGNAKATLDIDEIVLKDDIGDDEKMALIQQTIQPLIKKADPS